MIEILLDHGADIDARSTWWAGGFGALDFADEETSDWLLSRGATLTPHAAARLGKFDALRAMLEADPSIVHHRGGDGQFPLHFAKTPEIVDLLVDAGADLEARDLDHNGTALQFRILEAEVRRQLLNRGAKPDIFSAVAEDEPDLVSRLLENDPEAADRKTTDSGNPQLPKAPGEHIYLYLLGTSQPHQVATNLGSKRAFQALWERASPPQRLAMACWAEDRRAALEIAERHPGLAKEISSTNARMLPDAAWIRKTNAVKLMLELGWDVDAVGGEASTAVDRAAFHGFDDVIEAVLPYGPELNRRNVYGGTPLGACLYGSVHSWRRDGNHARSVELLLSAGSPPPEHDIASAEVREVLKKLRTG
jgi:ankyrin repeat protein